MPAHDYASTRYSDLADIDTNNVRDLTVQFTFSTGVNRGQEGAPLVVNGTMYIVAPYPNELFALDLTKPGAPLKWSYKPDPKAAAQGVACCDVVNRGGFYYEGAIYYATLDGKAVAVDAGTGKQLWKTGLADISKGETITMAPEVVKGKVLIGNSGGEYGVRGWLAALDAKSGAIQWKAFSTGPDSEVLLGPDFKPFYNSERGTELGMHTWSPGALEDRRGHGMGMDFIRPGSEFHLLRNGKSGPLEPRATSWGHQVDGRNFRP
jgi:glucose dehydrogenase